MNKENNIKEILNQIQHSEGESFIYDEIAIENEYKKLSAEPSGLAIKVVSIFGGILAAMAFIGFLIIAGLYDSETGLIFFGLVFIGIAIYINLKFDKLILDTFSITAFLIGFYLLAFGLISLHLNENLICLLFIIIALISLYISQNYILSFIAVLIINGSLLYMTVNFRSYHLIHIYNAVLLAALCYFFLNEAKLITYGRTISKLYNPLRTGLIISVITGLVFVGKKQLFYFSSDYRWLSSIITIPLIIYVVSVICDILKVRKLQTKILIYGTILAFLLPTVYSPAISGSLLIILLSFLVTYKTGLAFGVIAFIYFISQFYYDLSFTLLTKSMILLLSGIILLLLYLFTFKQLKKNEEI